MDMSKTKGEAAAAGFEEVWGSVVAYGRYSFEQQPDLACDSVNTREGRQFAAPRPRGKTFFDRLNRATSFSL